MVYDGNILVVVYVGDKIMLVMRSWIIMLYWFSPFTYIIIGNRSINGNHSVDANAHYFLFYFLFFYSTLWLAFIFLLYYWYDKHIIVTGNSNSNCDDNGNGGS